MLTTRQKQIKEFINKTLDKKDVAPTEREIARQFKISPSTAHEHLETLHEKGYLEKARGRARGIKVLGSSAKLVRIPLLGTIAAGQPLTLFDLPKETIAVTENIVPPSSDIYALRVSGNSMIDENINDGDIILVRQQKVAENGQRVVALIDNYEATLKKFYREKGHIRLQPANKTMEPLIFRKDHDVAIQGVVIDVIHEEVKPTVPQPENIEADKFEKLPINKIICGDAVSIMKKIPDGSVDLIVTSPPYNLKNSTGNGMKDGRGGKWANAALQKGYSHHDDCMPHHEYVAWQRNCLTEMLRIIPNNGAIFYNHKWRVQAGLLQDRQDIISGFPVRQIIIWRRKGGFNFNPGYFVPTYEVIYMIAKPQFKLSPKANGHGDVWEFTQEMSNDHPAAFPVPLIDRIIGSTNAEVVLDPFMGSGTTAISAMNLKRNYIGIEISPDYCKMAEKRIRLTFPNENL